LEIQVFRISYFHNIYVYYIIILHVNSILRQCVHVVAIWELYVYRFIVYTLVL